MATDGASPHKLRIPDGVVRCRCGCGRDITQKSSGRRRLFYDDDCKNAFHNRRNGVIRTDESRTKKRFRRDGGIYIFGVEGPVFLPLSSLCDSEMFSARSTTRTGRDEQLWAAIERLEARLDDGLLDRSVRNTVRRRGAQLLAAVEQDPSGSRDEVIGRGRLFGLLFRAGVEGGRLINRSEAAILRRYANTVAALFRKVDDVNYARAVLVCGAAHYMCRDSAAAQARFDYAWSLLRDAHPRDGEVAHVHWHAAVRYLRFHPEDRKVYDRLRGLADDFPIFRMEYLSECVGHESRNGRHARAKQCESELDAVIRSTSAFSQYDELRWEKTRVWALLRSGQVREAEERIRDYYVPAYTAYPEAYSAEQVLRWAFETGLRPPHLSPAEYRLHLFERLPHYCPPRS